MIEKASDPLKCVYFQSKMAQGQVLDISQNIKSLGHAVLYKYHHAPNQHFQVSPSEQKSFVYIKSHLSGKVLTVSGGINDNGNAIIEQENTNKPSQKFKFEPTGEKDCYFILTYSKKAVDIFEGNKKNDTPIIQWQKHGDPNQIWKIKIAA